MSKTVGGPAFGIQVLSAIAMTAVTAVFKTHRALRSTELSENATVTPPTTVADLLDTLHRALRLFALCKISGDMTKEVRGVRRL